MHQAVDVQIARAQKDPPVGNDAWTGRGPAVLEFARIAPHMEEVVRVALHKVALVGPDIDRAAIDAAIRIDAARTAGHGDGPPQIGDVALEMDIGRRCLDVVAAVAGFVGALHLDHRCTRRALGVAGHHIQTRGAAAAEIHAVDGRGRIDHCIVVTQHAAFVAGDLELVEHEEVRRVVGDDNARIAGRVQLAAAPEFIAPHVDIAQLDADVAHIHIVGDLGKCRILLIAVAVGFKGQRLAILVEGSAGQPQLDQLELQEVDLRLVRGHRRVIADIRRNESAQVVDALLDAGRDQLVALHRRLRDVAGLVELGAPQHLAVLDDRLVDDIALFVYPFVVQRQPGLALYAGLRRAVDLDLGHAGAAGAAALDVEAHIAAAEQAAYGIGDGRCRFAVQILAYALGAGLDRAFLGIQRDVLRRQDLAAGRELHVGVVDDIGLCIGIAADGKSGLVVEIDGRIGIDVSALAVGGLARGQQHRTVAGLDARIAADKRAVLAAVVGMGLARRCAGRAVDIDRGTRVQRHVRARARADIAQIADNRRVVAKGGRGVRLHRQAGVGTGLGNGAAGVELDLVLQHDGVQRVQVELAVAAQQVHVGARAYGRGRALGDRGLAGGRRQIEQTARARTDVPAGCVAIAAAYPGLAAGVHGVDIHLARAHLAIDAGMDAVVHGVERVGTAGADDGRIGAVDLCVEIRHMRGLDLERIHGQRACCVAAAGPGRGAAGAAGRGRSRHARDHAAAAGHGVGPVGIGAVGGDGQRGRLGIAAGARQLDAVAQRGLGLAVRGGRSLVEARGDDAGGNPRGLCGLLRGVARIDQCRAAQGQRAAVAHPAGDARILAGSGMGGVDTQQAAGRARRMGGHLAAGLPRIDAQVAGRQLGLAAQAGIDTANAFGHGLGQAHGNTPQVQALGIGAGRGAGRAPHGHIVHGIHHTAVDDCLHRRLGLGGRHSAAGGQAYAAGQRRGLGFGIDARIGQHTQGAYDIAALNADLRAVGNRGHGAAPRFGLRHRSPAGHLAHARTGRACLDAALVLGLHQHFAGVPDHQAMACGGMRMAGIGDARIGPVHGLDAAGTGKAQGTGLPQGRGIQAQIPAQGGDHVLAQRRLVVLLDVGQGHARAQTHRAHGLRAGLGAEVQHAARVHIEMAAGVDDGALANACRVARCLGGGEAVAHLDAAALRLRLRRDATHACIAGGREHLAHAVVRRLAVGLLARRAVVLGDLLLRVGAELLANAVDRHPARDADQSPRGADHRALVGLLAQCIDLHIALGVDLRAGTNRGAGTVARNAHIDRAGQAGNAAREGTDDGLGVQHIARRHVHVLQRIGRAAAGVDAGVVANRCLGGRLHHIDRHRAGHAGKQAARAAGGHREQIFARCRLHQQAFCAGSSAGAAQCIHRGAVAYRRLRVLGDACHAHRRAHAGHAQAYAGRARDHVARCIVAGMDLHVAARVDGGGAAGNPRLRAVVQGYHGHRPGHTHAARGRQARAYAQQFFMAARQHVDVARRLQLRVPAHLGQHGVVADEDVRARAHGRGTRDRCRAGNAHVELLVARRHPHRLRRGCCAIAGGKARVLVDLRVVAYGGLGIGAHRGHIRAQRDGRRAAARTRHRGGLDAVLVGRGHGQAVDLRLQRIGGALLGQRREDRAVRHGCAVGIGGHELGVGHATVAGNGVAVGDVEGPGRGIQARAQAQCGDCGVAADGGLRRLVEHHHARGRAHGRRARARGAAGDQIQRRIAGGRDQHIALGTHLGVIVHARPGIGGQ